MVGPELYGAFFRGYTRKQWGLDPSALPASILKRLPLRFNYDDAYFDHPHQAIPEDGYTALVAAILNTPGVEFRLGAAVRGLEERFAHVVYSGPIDRYFDYEFGPARLPHAGLRRHSAATGDHQGTAVLNYCDEATPVHADNRAQALRAVGAAIRRHDLLPRIQPGVRSGGHSRTTQSGRRARRRC